jgi:hypothetical protein
MLVGWSGAEACEFLGLQHYLAKRGTFAPKEVSLTCFDNSPLVGWYEPR